MSRTDRNTLKTILNRTPSSPTRGMLWRASGFEQ
jgi:hypothetical protein